MVGAKASPTLDKTASRLQALLADGVGHVMPCQWLQYVVICGHVVMPTIKGGMTCNEIQGTAIGSKE